MRFGLIIICAVVLGALAIVAHGNGQRIADTATVALSDAADGAAGTIDDLGNAANARQQADFEAEQRRRDTLAWQQVHATETAVALYANERETFLNATATALAIQAEREMQQLRQQTEQEQAAAALPTSTASTGLSPWALLPWVLVLLLTGTGGAGVVYLWRRATGANHTQVVEVEAMRTQAQIETERARHQHALPPTTYAPHVSSHVAPHYAPHDARRMELPRYGDPAPPAQPQRDLPPTGDGPLPPATDFADLLSDGSIGRGCPIVVGQSTSGLRTATWGELYSTAIGGLSGTGKSWTAACLVAQSLLNRAQVALVDPDARDPNSLSARLSPLACGFLCDPAEAEAQIAALCALLTDELEARSKGSRERRPLVVAIDEYNDLVRHVPALATLVDLIGRRGRRQQMFALCLSHQWQGKRTGGSDVRDVFASAFIHRLRPAQARMLTGLTSHELPDDVLHLPEGHAYLLDNRGRLERIVVPHTTSADIQQVAGLVGDDAAVVELPPRASASPTVRPDSGQLSPSGTVAATASQSATQHSAMLYRVVALFQAGKSVAEIVGELHGITSKAGKPYQQARAEVEQMLRSALSGTDRSRS